MPKIYQNTLFKLACMIVFMWTAYACAGDLEDAKNAYGAGRFEEAANLLRPLVRQEVIEAVYLQARMYEKGDGVSKDLKEARHLYSIAAAGGHEASQQKLDIFNVQSSDKSVVIDWYLPAAQEGDTEAQYNLGFMYETGWGVSENLGEAIRWYKEASENQHDVAQLRLAMMTIVGAGTEASMKKGLVLLRRSAENGNRVAEILIQDMFDVGDVSDKNAKQIVSGIRRIFDDGELETIKTLRRSLNALHEIPTEDQAKPIHEATKVAPLEKPVDVVKAVTLRNEKAANPVVVAKEDTHAENEKGSKKVGKENLFKWYIEEANNGEADAQYHLGALYIKGEQVEKDLEEGLHWMKLAAEQGHELAVIYTKLWEDDFNANSFSATIAVSWLKASGREWNQQAIFTLGTLYETGRGVEKNFKKAMQWYQFAAVNGHSSAKRRLALIKKGGALLEQEGVSRRVDMSAFPGVSLIIAAIVALLLGLAIFVYKKYVRTKRIARVPEQYQQKVVMEKAKNSQGLQTDDRKFFDELWSASSNAVNKASSADGRTQESEPEIQQKPTIESQAARESESKEKPDQKPEPDAEKEKSEGLSQIEERLAKAVEDLVSSGGVIAPVKIVDKSAARATVEIKSNAAHITIKSGQEIPLEKNQDSTQTPVGTLAATLATKDKQKAVSASEIKGDNVPVFREQTLGAENFISGSISIDELAASRISADSLFADGVAIDEAGRAVGQGSYDPHKLDADAVSFNDASSIARQSGLKKDRFDVKKPRPVGAAASLLPKQGLSRAPMGHLKMEPIAFKVSTETVENNDIAAPLSSDEERSLAEVHYNIGLMFSSGDGVPKNDAQAAKWFLKAAEEDLPEAQFSLGEAYLNGNGVVQNTDLALGWIQKAAGNNYKPAQEILKEQNKAI